MPNKKNARRRLLTFDDVREIALSMPEVEETTAYGMPWFKAGKTRFAGRPVQRADVEPNSLGLLMSFEERDRRIAAQPEIYYLTEHFAKGPGVLVRLSNIRRDELREILGMAWHYAMGQQSPTRNTRGKRPRHRAARR